jgi:hypothetical protein
MTKNKTVIAIMLSIVLSCTFAYAGFSVVDDTANTKVGFLECTKVGSQLKMVSSVALGSGPFTLESDETLVNSVDDTVEVKSNDEVTTFRVEGFEAKNAIFQLAADDGDDAGDVFDMRMDTSGLLSIGVGGAYTSSLDANGDWIMGGTTPRIVLGDAGAEDSSLVYDGNAQDFYMALDDTDDKLKIGLGQTAGSTERLSFNSADLSIVVGDATAADVGFIFDGNAQDFHIGMDDSADKLVIGLGSAYGTTERLTFNSADLSILVGDATGADAGFIFDGNAQDYHIGIDDTADDLVIGLGSAYGTTPAISIDENQVVTLYQDSIFGGTTPLLTVGDAGAEDAAVLFDGNAQDFHIGLDDTADKLVIGLGAALGTTERLTFNSADLNILVGDATAADVLMVFDGNAQDFHVGMDDSDDKLVIGLGSAAGTTERLSFNSADLNIIVGDGTAADAGFIYNGNAQDYNISIDDTADDLVIGLGSAAGTTDAMRIDENQDVTFVQDILPLSTITGDGGAALSGMLQAQVAGTTASLTIAQCGSTIVSDSADVQVLPEASTALGCRYTFVCGTADDYDVNPADGTDQIGPANVVGGGSASALAPAAGDAIRCTDIGSSIVLEAVAANLWAVIGVANGPWTDVN